MTTSHASWLSDETQAFLRRPHRLLIGGEWVAAHGGESIDVLNPADATSIAEVPAANAKDIDQAVAAARAAFERGEWPALPPSDRAQRIFKLADLVEAHGKVLTELETLDNGMPMKTAGALAVPWAVKVLRYYAGWATKIAGQTIPHDRPRVPGSDGFTYTRREPVGVVGQIIPWNYPLAMAVMKLGPALATGCTVILKPAELTPLSALYLGQLISEAEIPSGVVNIVPGYGETAGAAITAHPGIDKIAFTGSTDTGKQIIAASAGNLKRVSLELGGKSPFIVFPDADIEAAGQAAARFAFFLQGQNCMCASRVFVHESVRDRVIAIMRQAVDAMPMGPGWQPETVLGPMISADQRDRARSFVDEGRGGDAEIVHGGNVLDGPGFFLAPAIAIDPKPGSRLLREEIFGPVTCVQTFSGTDLDALAAAANDTPYGLAASVWTRDLATAHAMAARLKVGVVGINHHGGTDVLAPFGGMKQSGWGRENGEESLDHYLETKSVVTRYQWSGG